MAANDPKPSSPPRRRRGPPEASLSVRLDPRMRESGVRRVIRRLVDDVAEITADLHAEGTLPPITGEGPPPTGRK